MRRIIALLLVIAALAGRAQEPPDISGYQPLPEEKRLMDLADHQKPIEAREAAQKYLETHPESFVACAVLGRIYLREDGDLPRAYYYLARGRKILENEFGGLWSKETPWRLYMFVLWDQHIAARHMERYEEDISILKLYNSIFLPKQEAHLAWPLMKLGRTREAREVIARALQGKDEDEREVALNGLGALQGESDQIDQCYATFTQLYDSVHRPGRKPGTTDIRNRADAAQRLQKFQEAEELYLESSKFFEPEDASNPWMDLALLYIQEQRLPEAIDAVKRMHDWSFHSLPIVAQDGWNRRRCITGYLLLACGFTDEALRLAEQVAYRPDRHGSGSANGEQFEASSLLFYRVALLDRAARLGEEMSWCRARDWPGLAAQRALTLAKAWSAGRQAGRIIMANGWLGDTLRFYAPKSVVDQPSGEFQLPGVVGDGVTLAQARKLLARSGKMAERERPFVLAICGESKIHTEPAKALRDLRASEGSLPKEMAAVRTEAVAFQALAYRKLGDGAGLARMLATLMARDPVAIRRWGLSIPVSILDDGGTAAKRAAELLDHSPRLSKGPSPYHIRVAQRPSGALDGALEAPDGSILCLLHASPGRDADATAREFCREFHLKAFAPKMDLTQQDINSIEGSTLASQDARKQLKGILAGETDTK